MSKLFAAVSLLVILVSACNQPISGTSLPTGETPDIQLAASATATPLFNTENLNPAETQTPSIVTATGEPCAAPAPRVAIGEEVLVLVEDWDKLKLRSEPVVSTDTVIMELDQFSQLKILDGPVCVSSAEPGYSYWFWKVVVIPSAETGWVAEGDYSHYFIEKYR